jgi:amino acid adenylation domain-containing protein
MQTVTMPLTELELVLVKLWKEILRINKISITDNFFELGGSSKTGEVLVHKLRQKLGEYVYVAALFDAPTIREFALYLEKYYPESVVKLCKTMPHSNSVSHTVQTERTMGSSEIEQVRQLITPLLPYDETEKSSTSKNPSAIFIFSPQRSGSTLLRAMLAGHPLLFAPPELNLLSFNTIEDRKQYCGERYSFMLDGTLKALTEVKSCNVEQANSIMESYEKQKLPVKQFYRQLQEWVGDKILVDKSTSYALDVETLKRAELDFDNALYIHLTRHPYGMIRSFEELRLDRIFFRGAHPFAPQELAELIWTICHQNILDFLSYIPTHRQYRIKFEDIVVQPKATLEGLCQFLSLQFYPNMLRPYIGDKMVGGSDDPKFVQHKTIDATVAEHWKTCYTDDFIGDITWDIAEILGYEKPYNRGQQLGKDSSKLNLPTDRPRMAVQPFQWAYKSLTLSKRLTNLLRTIVQQEGATLFVTLLTVFKILLYRYTGQNDILVGTFFANHSGNQLESESVVHLSALHSNLSYNPSFRELSARILGSLKNTCIHNKLPFEKAFVKVIQDQHYSQDFQFIFHFEEVLLQKKEQHFEQPVFKSDTNSFFELAFCVVVEEEELIIKLNYNSVLFNESTIDRMLGHFRTLLEAVVKNSDQRISDLPLLTNAEYHQIVVEWNDTQADFPQNTCIHQLFEAQVKRTPNAVAVIFGNEQLSYQELNKRANQLAHYLRSLGVEKEIPVGICVERSLNMIVSLLGILKAGGAYVPLDPKYPKDRLAFMILDSQVPILLTQDKLLAKLPELQTKVIRLDAEWQSISQKCEKNVFSDVTAKNLAYIIYTSGSTGKPKGVTIEHYSTVNLLSWAGMFFSAEQIGGILASTSICFDLSVFEIFVPLSYGGKVILAETALDLSTLPAKENVTLLNTVPSAISGIIKSGGIPSSVHTVNLAGEPLPHKLVKEIYKQDTIQKIFNLYGPSEDTTYTTFALIEKGHTGQPSIGRPIANTQIYILDSHLKPVPIGVSGELYIGGVCLARGYLNRPELTEENFIPNPFSEDVQSRLYKTGDLARYLPDGNIEYVGRIDNQVKIRGYRVELGEIQTIMEQYPKIQQVAVTHYKDSQNDNYLAAYVVPNKEHALTINELQQFLKEKLPEYMVPSFFVLLEQIPLTPNGKVDNHALPVPDTARPKLEQPFVAPRTPVEKILVDIWSEVLGIEKIGIHDKFFELGGHSLRATQIISRLQSTFPIKLTVRHFFEFPTVASLAESITEKLSCEKQKSRDLTTMADEREEIRL